MSITVAEQDRMAARLAEIRPFLDERAWRLRYDRARMNLDRHPTYRLAVFMSSGT